jgi:hypothetical protein
MRNRASRTSMWWRCGLMGVLAAALMLLSPLAGAQAATTTTLTFDELPAQPVNGVSIDGVTFQFEVGGAPSSDATYGSAGPGTITFVQDPSLEGNSSGTLTLVFDPAVSDIEFGVALSASQALTPGFSVELFGPGGNSLGVTPVNTSPLVSFTEGKFTYSGAPVSKAVITFDASAGRFALDNLGFTTAPTGPTSKEQCKNGGWQSFGFRNQGLCIKSVNEALHSGT